ncbi:Oligoribonuclease, mitochondrial [Hypsibius exemplaris]|uniref:Probable oligoribonuclease n=1 Tax=Hypsibius exemplaris TaxID=2072580 RepID=A0A1W0X266_HYPEX|nr:Oligoribonuclease, mitochondrial [Hypsibius exemplaris]
MSSLLQRIHRTCFQKPMRLSAFHTAIPFLSVILHPVNIPVCYHIQTFRQRKARLESRHSVSCHKFGSDVRLQKGLHITAIYSRKMSAGALPPAAVSIAEKNDRIIWVDLEMSGLEPETQTIVEMACVITDGQLNVIAESPNLIINHPEVVLKDMSDWCKDSFGKSGLLAEICESKTSLSQAEEIMLAFVRAHTNAKTSPLAGNSVHMDRLFLRKYMPSFTEHLHYRIMDVSSVKEMVRRWYPEVLTQMPPKKEAHRAMSDIKESIAELQWYRQNVFRSAC